MASGYLETIANSLKRREEILQHLRMIGQSPESISYRPEIDSFVQTLRNASDAEELLADGSMAMWLPTILEYQELPADGNQQMTFLAASIANSSDIRFTRSYTLLYVLLLGLTTLAVFTYLCGSVIPLFNSMFREMNLQTPWPTAVVLWLGEFFGPYSQAIFMIAVASLIMIWLGRRILGRLTRDKAMVGWLARWNAGSSTQLIAMSRHTATLACLLRIEMPLRDAFVVAGRASMSPTIVQRSVRLMAECNQSPIEMCLTSAAFPPLMIDTLSEDGIARNDRLLRSTILRELGAIYSERARHRFEWISKMLLPLFVLLIGGAVGLLILALFLPLFSLVQSLF